MLPSFASRVEILGDLRCRRSRRRGMISRVRSHVKSSSARSCSRAAELMCSRAAAKRTGESSQAAAQGVRGKAHGPRISRAAATHTGKKRNHFRGPSGQLPKWKAFWESLVGSKEGGWREPHLDEGQPRSDRLYGPVVIRHRHKLAGDVVPAQPDKSARKSRDGKTQSVCAGAMLWRMRVLSTSYYSDRRVLLLVLRRK